MQIQEAVETCVAKKYADFDGRATRSEFWWFMLFCLIINSLLGVAAEWAAGIFFVVMLVPSLAVTTRRLRDTNRSPMWWLLILIPVAGWIALLVFFAQRGVTPATPATPTHPGSPAAPT